MPVRPETRLQTRPDKQLDRPETIPPPSEYTEDEPSFTSVDKRTSDADLQYLGIETDDPNQPGNLALEAIVVTLLGAVFILDIHHAANISITSLYVVVIFLAARLQRARWVVGVTIASLLLNLIAIRWHTLNPPVGWDMKSVLTDLALAAFAQVPAGFLAYQAIVSQRRLERTSKETARRQRAMYERERAARAAEHESRRRELLATDELRVHTENLKRSLENERQARRSEREAVVERDHLRWLTEKFQRTLLPTVPPEIAGGRLALGPLYQPAIQEMQMGGDFYDAMTLPNGMVGLVIGDVAGHGVEAAAQTALVTTTLRAFATEDPLSPGRVLSRVNRSLTLDRNFEGFVSVFYGVFNPETYELRYSNAGHEPPILIHTDAECEALESTGLVVGVDTSVAYAEREVKLACGDCLVMITDGITEARHPETGRMFGWKGAAKVAIKHREMVRQLPRRSGDDRQADFDLAEAIYRGALTFAGADGEQGPGLSDDVALLTVVVLTECDNIDGSGPRRTFDADGESRGGSAVDMIVTADRPDFKVAAAATEAPPLGLEHR
jgi:serine phosphatase RsbU (regulator of sigma subunit)